MEVFLMKMHLKLLPKPSFAIRYHHLKGDNALDSWELSSVFVTAADIPAPVLLPEDRCSRLCSDLHDALHYMYGRGMRPSPATCL